jgi:hypothetical protein
LCAVGEREREERIYGSTKVKGEGTERRWDGTWEAHVRYARIVHAGDKG